MIADGARGGRLDGRRHAAGGAVARPRLFTDFFRQRFAQVTNPSVDPYREVARHVADDAARRARAASSTSSAPRPPRIVLRSPILSRRAARAARRGVGAVSRRRSRIVLCRSAQRRATAFDGDGSRRSPTKRAPRSRGGSALVVLTDRRVDAGTRAVPALLAHGGGSPGADRPRPAHARQHRRRHRRRARRAPARRCCSATARPRSARRSATTRSQRSPADPTGCDVGRRRAIAWRSSAGCGR